MLLEQSRPEMVKVSFPELHIYRGLTLNSSLTNQIERSGVNVLRPLYSKPARHLLIPHQLTYCHTMFSGEDIARRDHLPGVGPAPRGAPERRDGGVLRQDAFQNTGQQGGGGTVRY